METLKYGVNFLNYLSQQLADLDGITTLAHELIQNADDAKDDAGKLAATQITFDIRDNALIVSNDAVFREEDFDRLREVASASKRSESGDRTTGAFGVGFVSVYQITDRPEICSAGRRWTLRPEDQEIDEDHSENNGTTFRLPWTSEKSRVRNGLQKPPVGKDSIDSFAEELKESLPRAILFLQKLDTIELLRNGEPVSHMERVVGGNTTKVGCDGVIQTWRFIEGNFFSEASGLKGEFSPTYIEGNRSDRVQIAIPDSLRDDGLLFATLPTKQSTGLPFHINADFFPSTDRKSIVFGDTRTRVHRSEWNRAAMRAAAAAVGDNLIALRDMFRDDAPTFWGILDRLQDIHKDRGDDTRIPLGAFWGRLSPSLPSSPIVYTESGKWVTPSQVYIPTGDKEKEAVSAFGALGIEIVHRDLLKYRNILTSIGVGVLRIEHIYEALKNKGMVRHTPSDEPLPDGTLELLWKGIHGVLDNTQGRAKRLEAKSLLKQCALAPGIDGRLWPCRSVYRADAPTHNLFALLMSRNAASFLAERGLKVPLLRSLCTQFKPGNAISELECLDSEDYQAQWRNGSFDPATLLHWFDGHKLQLTGDLSERLAQLPIFPSARKLRPLEDLWLQDGFPDPIGVAALLDMGKLNDLGDFLRRLGASELTFTDYARDYIPGAFAADSAVSQDDKRKLLDILAERIGSIRDDQEVKARLAAARIVECAGGLFRQPGTVYLPNEDVKAVLGNHVDYALRNSESRTELYRLLGIQEQPRIEDILWVIDEQIAHLPSQGAGNEIVRIAEAVGKAWATLGKYTLKGELATRCIVECTDGEFRRPAEVYFPNKGVKEILGDHVSYARLPEKSKGRTKLYRRLDVKSRPHAKDILRAIDKLAARTPAHQKTRKEMVNILENIGKDWEKPPDSEKERYSSLKNKAWLPAEGESSRWYRPDELYAANNKSLFESQAQFLDLPIRVQREIRKCLECLGVNRSPQPSHVVEHLLWCSERNQAPPRGIEGWLNSNAQPGDLEGLRCTTCIHIGGGEYRCPDQVFWGRHPFGRFCIQLPHFQQHHNLNATLGIREAPDYRDAIRVLKDISAEMGNDTLRSEDKDGDAVLQCWVMLSEELSKARQREDINARIIRPRMIKSELQNINCVPNNQEQLRMPSEMFFEDSAVPLDNFPDLFELFSSNLTKRRSHVYLAMEAAGVRPISAVVLGVADEPVNPRECEKMRERFTERTKLIKAVSEGVTGNGGIPFEDIRFLQADELKMKWHTNLFCDYSTPLEPVPAHLDRDKQAIYFTSQGSDYPWLDIAVELTKAIAPGEEISSTASTITMVLQAAAYKDAVSLLKKLHKNIPEELGDLASTGAVAESLDEAYPSDGDQELSTPPQDDSIPGDIDEPAESVPTPQDDEDDTYAEPGGDSDAGTGGDETVLATGNGNGTATVARGGTRGGESGRRGRSSGDDGDSRSGRQAERRPRGGGRTQFHSYIEVRLDEEAPSPEGSEAAARKSELEESAIAFILKCEPEWECTPPKHEGYDLEKIDHNGVISLCEVKAMTGTWDDRPVTVSSAQFEKAQECGDSYWLYVVENAGTDSPNIVKIQDPAGQAQTFTFDNGWREVAVIEDIDTEPSF